MPWRTRAGACRVPPSGLVSEPSGSAACSASPARAGVAPPASCAAWSGPLRCADDCAPPVGSAFSLLVPGAFSSLIASPSRRSASARSSLGAPRAVSRSCRLPLGANLIDDGTSSVLCPDSASSAARLVPSGSSMILAWILRIASMSISGRGGQPGRYMSTGTTWSTPCTIA